MSQCDSAVHDWKHGGSRDWEQGEDADPALQTSRKTCPHPVQLQKILSLSLAPPPDQNYGFKKGSSDAHLVDIMSVLEDIRNDRQQSPPAASFLEQFLKIGGRVNGRATRESDLELEERPSTWAQLVQERDQLNLLRSSIVPGHRMPRQLLASPPVRGCHLGTCQIQNLANLLYRYGGNNQKEESHKNNKGTNDPMGYGRRKRRAAGHGVSSPT
ncbi:hypothetical protein Chor_009179 [Crotalus horridus]